jgi:hypothetical protein
MYIVRIRYTECMLRWVVCLCLQCSMPTLDRGSAFPKEIPDTV